MRQDDDDASQPTSTREAIHSARVAEACQEHEAAKADGGRTGNCLKVWYFRCGCAGNCGVSLREELLILEFHPLPRRIAEDDVEAVTAGLETWLRRAHRHPPELLDPSTVPTTTP